MELNTLIYCFALWIVAELISLCISVFRWFKEAHLFYLRKLYLQRINYFLRKGSPFDRLLRDVYMSFLGRKKHKALQRIVFKGMIYGDISRGFEYIESKIGCYPIYVSHEAIIKKFDRNVIIEQLNSAVDNWENALKEVKGIIIRNGFIVFFEKIIFCGLNLALYNELKSEISLVIFIVVNTISVIWFILQQHELARVNEFGRDGNLAWQKQTKKLTHAPAFRCKQLYQIAGAMGLIINIALFTAQYLEQVV